MDLNKKTTCISIVLPVYNGEKHVEKAIKSVLNQSYSNYELIIVDDGSTDKTTRILSKFKNKENVRIIKKNNGGVSSARNAGISYATGDYLMFLDSDDELTDDCLCRLAQHIDEHKNIDLIIFGWLEQGIKNDIRRITNRKVFIDAELCIEHIIKTEYECGGGYPWNKLWKISTIKKDQNRIPEFNRKLVLCEDKEWVIKLLLKCKTILLIPDILYRYYIGEGDHLSKIDFNIIDKKNDIRIMSFVEASISIKKILFETGSQSYQIANRQSMEDIIMVCFKATRNRNGDLLEQVRPYFKKYVEKEKKYIGIKYWIMIFYLRFKHL